MRGRFRSRQKSDAFHTVRRRTPKAQFEPVLSLLFCAAAGARLDRQTRPLPPRSLSHSPFPLKLFFSVQRNHRITTAVSAQAVALARLTPMALSICWPLCS